MMFVRDGSWFLRRESFVTVDDVVVHDGRIDVSDVLSCTEKVCFL
jgi:hypothetical protein